MSVPGVPGISTSFKEIMEWGKSERVTRDVSRNE